jgi:hypothetical protein
MKAREITYTSTDHDDVEIHTRLGRWVTKHCAIRGHGSIGNGAFGNGFDRIDGGESIMTTSGGSNEQWSRTAESQRSGSVDRADTRSSD